MSIIERIKNILITPKTEFPALKSDTADIGRLYKEYIVYVAAMPAVGVILNYGKYAGIGYRFRFAIVNYLVLLGSFYLSAYIINSLAPSFRSTKNMTNALKLTVYAATPTLVAGLLAFLPGLGALLSLVGLLYAVYLFYIGLPVFMETPQESVITFMVAAFVVSLVVYFILMWVLGPIFGVSMIL